MSLQDIDKDEALDFLECLCHNEDEKEFLE